MSQCRILHKEKDKEEKVTHISFMSNYSLKTSTCMLFEWFLILTTYSFLLVDCDLLYFGLEVRHPWGVHHDLGRQSDGRGGQGEVYVRRRDLKWKQEMSGYTTIWAGSPMVRDGRVKSMLGGGIWNENKSCQETLQLASTHYVKF